MMLNADNGMNNRENIDALFMEAAISEAKAAAASGEVPIGAVAVRDGEIIARARNEKENGRDPTAHAEVILLRETAKILGGWRLSGVTVYVTLEPCPMCAGAMVLARIDRLVFGTLDPKMGAVRTLYNIADDPRLNHRIEITAGVREAECAAMLSDFFRERRRKIP